MRTRPKRRQVGTASPVIRYRNGTCAHECRACGHWETFAHWRPALRSAKAHAIDHAAGDVGRYTLTTAGSRLVARPRPRWRRRLAVAGVVLVLAVIAFAATVAGMASRAAPTPAPPIGIVTATTAGIRTYSPTPAGPPATDRHGQWISEPDPATSSTEGSR
jgi:hypothetical protein